MNRKVTRRGNSSSIVFFIFVGFLSIFLGLVCSVVSAVYAVMMLTIIVFIGIILYRYQFGVWIMLTSLPFVYTNFMPHQILGVKGLNPLNLFILITGFSMFLFQITKPDQFKLLTIPKPLKYYLFMITLAALGGSFFAHKSFPILDPNGVYVYMTAPLYIMDYYVKPIVIVIVAYMVGLYALNNNSAKILIWGQLTCYCLLFVILTFVILRSGISLSMLASPKGRSLLTWTGMHANELGLFFNFGLAFFLFSFLSVDGGWQRFWLFIGALCCGMMALVSFSRGAFLGLIFTGLYYFFTRRQIKPLIYGSIALIAILLLLPNEVYLRMSEGFTGVGGGAKDVSAGRIESIWMPLFPEFFNSPIWGHGLSSTLWADPIISGKVPIRPLPSHPHSAYLGVLLDFGLIGVVVVFYFFSSMWRLFRGVMKTYPDKFWRGYFEGASVCVLIFLVQGLTDDRFTPTSPQVYLWFAYGLGIGLMNRLGANLNAPASPARQTGKIHPQGQRLRRFKTTQMASG